ncbi:prepilin-type N-terminal cleavage/methylation domain-containing protein [Enterovibrio makurazakiensis]|uniref:Prepilin-type N-terminal cleavage/methylation domain-containing protein n=1 Tax=Enterovibrio gelatinilyticus TaxID=2899819 RepID=A0ABT5R6W3_9GAMM|nr:prepilin-type N-terminal cleavage/methylation domain-containing protein [Enterovibrio sp. ZSDZ42]MDD1795945.1 prepilin-type N-terminal cleavage/methylation domain-containing protein [Enterovibrio sp. ZSDZ42]
MFSVGKWNRQRGLSLIEMITTLSVLAAVTAVAVPNYMSAHKTAVVENKAIQLLSVLEMGQSESLKRHRHIYVHYVPTSEIADGCIGLSEKPDVSNFDCSDSEGLKKIALDRSGTLSVQEPELNAPSKLFHFSPMTGLPSNNKTVKLTSGTETGKESGVMIRQYSGLKGCSNTAIGDWESCPS